MKGITIEKTIQVTLSPMDLATAFCDMDADAQAEFFIACARFAQDWDGSPGFQWKEIGMRLKSKPDAVRMIAEIEEAARL